MVERLKAALPAVAATTEWFFEQTGSCTAAGDSQHKAGCPDEVDCAVMENYPSRKLTN